MRQRNEVLTTKLMALLTASFLCACSHASVLDLDSNTVQVSANAAPICGAEGAQRVTQRLAAIETIKHGFDRYIILGAQAGTSPQYAGTTPLVANSYGNGTASTFGNTTSYQGQSTTYFSGGEPIILNRHNQALQVRMFRADDPLASNALDARVMLGPDWPKLVAKGVGMTCAE